jgi:hypothetical protein
VGNINDEAHRAVPVCHSEFDLTYPPTHLLTYCLIPPPQRSPRLAELVAQLVPGIVAAAGRGAAEAGGAGGQGGACLGARARGGEQGSASTEQHAKRHAGAEQCNFLPVRFAAQIRAVGDVCGGGTEVRRTTGGSRGGASGAV